VASRVDSRVVLDEMGAEKLLGNGDMLFLLPGTSTLLRGQGTYLSDDEISRVVDFVATDAPQFASELLQLKTKEELEAAGAGGFQNRDELYESAVDIVVRERRGSVSLLQRALGIGYGRAARLVDYMAEDGIVGEYNGSQAREVLISLEQWDEMSRSDGEADQEVVAATAGGLRGTHSNHGTMHRATAPVGAAVTAGVALAESTTTAPRARRSNKILPEPEEPSDLEDELEDELEDDLDGEEYEEEEYEDEIEDEDESEEDPDEELEEEEVEDDPDEELEEEDDEEEEDEEWEEEDSDDEALDEDEEWEEEDEEEDETD
jgi:S-DNA-T family DNA segregation ATPase FtsK/SpoIIIE